jgi:hypothetical protein
MSDTTFKFTTKARKYLNEELILHLEGLNAKNIKNEIFTIHIDDVKILS